MTRRLWHQGAERAVREIATRFNPHRYGYGEFLTHPDTKLSLRTYNGKPCILLFWPDQTEYYDCISACRIGIEELRKQGIYDIEIYGCRAYDAFSHYYLSVCGRKIDFTPLGRLFDPVYPDSEVLSADTVNYTQSDGLNFSPFTSVPLEIVFGERAFIISAGIWHLLGNIFIGAGMFSEGSVIRLSEGFSIDACVRECAVECNRITGFKNTFEIVIPVPLGIAEILKEIPSSAIKSQVQTLTLNRFFELDLYAQLPKEVIDRLLEHFAVIIKKFPVDEVKKHFK